MNLMLNMNIIPKIINRQACQTKATQFHFFVNLGKFRTPAHGEGDTMTDLSYLRTVFIAESLPSKLMKRAERDTFYYFCTVHGLVFKGRAFGAQAPLATWEVPVHIDQEETESQRRIELMRAGLLEMNSSRDHFLPSRGSHFLPSCAALKMTGRSLCRPCINKWSHPSLGSRDFRLVSS